MVNVPSFNSCLSEEEEDGVKATHNTSPEEGNVTMFRREKKQSLYLSNLNSTMGAHKLANKNLLINRVHCDNVSQSKSRVSSY